MSKKHETREILLNIFLFLSSFLEFINIPSFHDLEEGELLGFPFSTFLLSFAFAVRLNIDQAVIYRYSFSLTKDFYLILIEIA